MSVSLRLGAALALLCVAGCDAALDPTTPPGAEPSAPEAPEAPAPGAPEPAPAPPTSAPPAPPPPTASARLSVPLHDGNTWNYEPVGHGGFAFHVAMAARARDGRTVYELSSPYGAYNLSYYEATAAGLRRVQTAPDGQVYRDLLFRYDPTSPTQYTHPTPRPDWQFTTRVVSAKQNVTTAAGTFEAVVVETTWTENGSVIIREEESFVAGVGVVRYVHTYRDEPPLRWDLASYRVTG